jgi:hypothetical protein
MRAKFWLTNLKGRDHTKKYGVDNVKMYLRVAGFVLELGGLK